MLYIAIIVFVVIMAGLTVLTFANFQNQNDVILSLIVWQTPPLPIGLLIMLAFCLGAFVLYLVSAVWAVQDTREIRRLRQRVAELEQRTPPHISAVSTGPLASAPVENIPPSTPVVPMPGMPPPPSPPDISDMTTLH